MISKLFQNNFISHVTTILRLAVIGLCIKTKQCLKVHIYNNYFFQAKHKKGQ